MLGQWKGREAIQDNMAYLKESHIDFTLGMKTGHIGSHRQAAGKTWVYPQAV